MSSRLETSTTLHSPTKKTSIRARHRGMKQYSKPHWSYVQIFPSTKQAIPSRTSRLTLPFGSNGSLRWIGITTALSTSRSS